jgi:HEAT repeat protein
VYTDHPTEPIVQVPVEGWVWAKQPFDRAAAEGDDAGLLALIKAALFRDEQQLSTEAFLTKILGGVRDNRAVSLLLRALADNNLAIQPRIIKILGFLQSRRALEPIRRAVTDDSDFYVRLAATAALVRIAGREALPEVVLALQDDDHWVREDAAWLLIELGDPQAIPALARALEDEHEDVREAAREALEALSGRGE